VCSVHRWKVRPGRGLLPVPSGIVQHGGGRGQLRPVPQHDDHGGTRLQRPLCLSSLCTGPAVAARRDVRVVPTR
jgi:hypothetical protein